MTVCPHCHRPTEVFVVSCDGHIIEAHRCRDHGDIIPHRYPIPAPCQIPKMRRSEEPGVYRTPPPAWPESVWDGEGP